MSDYWEELEKAEQERDAQEYAEAQAYREGYQQGRADVWADIEKIINGMTNPIDTMKIIIEQLKEQKMENKTYENFDAWLKEHDEKVMEDERAKVLKAVIDCGWHCEVHPESALYEMVAEQLKGERNDDRKSN